jgi:glucosamine-6-phosphate deaminase
MLIESQNRGVIDRKYRELHAQIFSDAAFMGIQAAQDFADLIQTVIRERGHAAVIMATGNSQLWFFSALSKHQEIAWSQVKVMMMDEYVGLPADHPGCLHSFVDKHLSNIFPHDNLFSLSSDAPDPEREMQRYRDLLAQYPPDVCVMGIGENGHLAFNDPPADFAAIQSVHLVRLDDACKRQQVGEGHFPSLESVPNYAYTLTIPALLAAPGLMVVVPEKRKAQAVHNALEGPVDPLCPASILQRQAHALIYLDIESASLLADPAASANLAHKQE